MSDDPPGPTGRLTQRWLQAELDGDVGVLDEISNDDFVLVGPLGFVLTKQQWLDRYRSGDLHTSGLSWDDVSVRAHDGVTVAIGRLTQRALHRGRPADGTFRVTQILLDEGAGLRLTGLHYSPIVDPRTLATG